MRNFEWVTVSGRFAYESFRLLSVRLRLESIRLRLICQFAYDSYVEALNLNYDLNLIMIENSKVLPELTSMRNFPTPDFRHLLLTASKLSCITFSDGL